MYSFDIRDKCPACGSADQTTWYQSSFEEPPIGTFVKNYYKIDPQHLSRAPYQLDRCGNCDLTYQKFVGSPELLRDLYTDWVSNPSNPDEEISTYRDEIKAVPHSRDAHEIMAASCYLNVPLSQLKVLDYGMGWALWARIAAELGAKSYGSDLAGPRMEFARRNGICTLTDDEISNHRFHFVNTEQVFEHVPQPLHLLKRLTDALEPGGIVKISVPSGERAKELVERLRSGRYAGDYQSIIPVQPLEHVNCFTRKSLGIMGGITGLRVVRPSYWQLYAFLRRRGTLPLTRPKKAAKELIRPWYQYRHPTNIYLWLRKPHE